ncbi:hypothetical protein MHIB_10690 [Mycolicibacter hiberniae]|uniref:Uncharacterized protein n=1 Tax=Mycolicibacter hiberniae TaxID=29314 RepID=A0A7I7X1F0_9MYCO|nr:hypothetical protein MHIB_10690 [Mycolicibacter hiberniae]
MAEMRGELLCYADISELCQPDGRARWLPEQTRKGWPNGPDGATVGVAASRAGNADPAITRTPGARCARLDAAGTSGRRIIRTAAGGVLRRTNGAAMRGISDGPR